MFLQSDTAYKLPSMQLYSPPLLICASVFLLHKCCRIPQPWTARPWTLFEQPIPPYLKDWLRIRWLWSSGQGWLPLQLSPDHCAVQQWCQEARGSHRCKVQLHHHHTVLSRQLQPQRHGTLLRCVRIRTTTIQNIPRVCGYDPTHCTQECKDTITAAHTALGCCVSVRNDTSYPYYYSLWLLCGVETVTERCKEPQFNPPPPAPPTHPPNAFNQQWKSQVLCRMKYIQSQLQVLRATEGCEEYKAQVYSAMVERCAANKNGATALQQMQGIYTSRKIVLMRTVPTLAHARHAADRPSAASWTAQAAASSSSSTGPCSGTGCATASGKSAASPLLVGVSHASQAQARLSGLTSNF